MHLATLTQSATNDQTCLGSEIRLVSAGKMQHIANIN